MASTIGKVRLSASELGARLTMTITISGMRVFILRRWLGMGLLRLATRVLPMPTRIIITDSDFADSPES